MKNAFIVLAGLLLSSPLAAAKDLPGLTLYAGYPSCTDLYSARMFWNLAQLDKVVGKDPTVAQAFQEIAESSMQPKRQPYWGDAPEHPSTHPRYQSHYCFVGKTPIVRLKKYEDHGRIEYKTQLTTIYSIDPGDAVLASLASMTSDPRYQSPCWAKVLDNTAGVVGRNDRLETISYATRRKAAQLKVTPKHRFLTKSADGTLTWTKAKDLKSGYPLFECTGAECRVTAIIDGPAIAAPRTGWEKFWAGIDVGQYRYVYNLSTDANTYYVGEPGAQILVHNIK